MPDHACILPPSICSQGSNAAVEKAELLLWSVEASTPAAPSGHHYRLRQLG